MKVNVAYLRERSTTGGWVNFAVFDAKSTVGDNDGLLYQLTQAAHAAGLQVDQSALAFNSGGTIRFYGSKNLVAHLAKNWRPQWTHTIDV